MLTRYNAFTGFDPFTNDVKLLQDTVSRWLDETTTGRPWTPAVDIIESENDVVLKADLPDVDMKNIHIQIENGTLSLKGHRKFENENKGKGYHRIERSYGSFARYFALPDTVDAEKVAADYKNGVLTITLPKKDIAKPRTVTVNVTQ
jgi:HSP20 family protein